jgi:hypothetical protein
MEVRMNNMMPGDNSGARLDDDGEMVVCRQCFKLCREDACPAEGAIVCASCKRSNEDDWQALRDLTAGLLRR